MNIIIKNSNNNILLKKGKKRFLGCPKVIHSPRLVLNLGPSSFLTISAIRLLMYSYAF